jgi:RND family efflux transporter MFP subunit
MKTIWTCSVFCLLLIACSSNKKDADEKGVSTVLPDEISEVRVMQLQYADFNHELIANGTVSAKNKADLRFQSTEHIAAIYVKNGDQLRKGQKIASLDTFKLYNNLIQAKSNMERSRLELHDIVIGQGYSLNDTAKIPKDIMRLAEVKSSYDQNVSQYLLAEYEYKNATLYTPFDGVVANLFVKAHNLPNASEPFCTIIDNHHPEAEFKILESELPLISVGNKVLISPFSINTYIYDGRITEINPVVDKNGMVRVKATINNAQNKLYDGMNIKIRIQRSLGKQLVVPKTALVLRSGKKVIFTLKDNKAQWVYVQTGLENSSGYVVTEGLKNGDIVIYEGNINLAHETPVKVINDN